uniref:Secreted protein n=1 Tax=Sander lucioperca TaxID=283035 RepID=A0A8D0AMS5_SANLU
MLLMGILTCRWTLLCCVLAKKVTTVTRRERAKLSPGICKSCSGNLPLSEPLFGPDLSTDLQFVELLVISRPICCKYIFTFQVWTVGRMYCNKPGRHVDSYLCIFSFEF